MSIHQAYRYALDPTPVQETRLIAFAGAARFAYNWGLALVKLRLNLRRALGPSVEIPWSYKALCSEFARAKDEVAPWRGEVIVGSFQTGFHALGQALATYSRARRAGRRAGFPRFRARGRSPVRVFSQDAKVLNSRHVGFPKVGAIKTREKTTKLLRLLQSDPEARILRGTVSRSPTGRWFLSFQVERSAKGRRPREPRSVVGVDLGLTHLATLSTGEWLSNLRPLLSAQRRLRRLRRQADRQRRANNPENFLSDGRITPGRKQWSRSHRMRRTETRIARVHERVANLRREQAHRLTTGLVRRHGVIGVESLNVAGMLGNRGLARHISDAGWGTILTQLTYKASWAGSSVFAADPFFPSSKICSRCGRAKAKLFLSERVFACNRCGLELDRDVNAALNLARVARDRAEAAGIRQPYVAHTRRETQNARGGQVSPAPSSRLSPSKREGSTKHESSRLREGPALALG